MERRWLHRGRLPSIRCGPRGKRLHAYQHQHQHSPPHTDFHRDPVQTTRPHRTPRCRPRPCWLSGALLHARRPGTHLAHPLCTRPPALPSTSIDCSARLLLKRLSARFETQTAPAPRDWLTGAVSEIASRPGKQLASSESSSGRLETRLWTLSCSASHRAPASQLTAWPERSPSETFHGPARPLARACSSTIPPSSVLKRASPAAARCPRISITSPARHSGQCSSLHLHLRPPLLPPPSPQAGPPGRWPITTIPPFLPFGSAIPTDSLQSAHSFFHSFPALHCAFSAGRNCFS